MARALVGTYTWECAFSADATGIPEGDYAAIDALTGEAMAELRVGGDGEIRDYAPVDAPQPWQGMVLALQRASREEALAARSI